EIARARVEIKAEVEKRIIGQQAVIDQLLTSLFSRGHCLFVGVPGLAKTLLISTLAEVLDLSFNRIQFTPDLMPSDITGTDVLEEDHATGRRAFRFIRGPIFAQLLLADEINRTPPKTQAALLQAMQEQRVSAGGETHVLPAPFLVFATQFLVLGAKARAILDGRPAPGVEDVRALARPTLQHRLITNFHAEAEGVKTPALIDRLLETVRP